MVISKEKISTLIEDPKKLVFRFLDCKKVDKVQNENFRLAMTVSMAKCDMSRILIDDESFCDIMYARFLKIWAMEREGKVV